MANFLLFLKRLEQLKYSVVELKHAYRINGMLDIWKWTPKLFIKSSNQYKQFNNHKDIIDYIINNYSANSTSPVFGSKSIISYKDFKRNSEIGNEFNAEDYHWNNSSSVNGEDHLYFLAIEGVVKIGRSKNPRDRLNSSKTMLQGIGIMYVFTGKGSLEKTFHMCFKDFKKNGEWFIYSDRIHKFIKKYHRNGKNGEIIHMKKIGA